MILGYSIRNLIKDFILSVIIFIVLSDMNYIIYMPGQTVHYQNEVID